MNERYKLLESEYDAIERRTGPDGLLAADYLVRSLDDPYAPTDDDHLRAHLRSAAEQVAATNRGLRVMGFLQELDDEIIRKYGPAGNDEDREKWESEVRAATIETVNRKFGTPEEAADRAINSMIADDRRAANDGKSDFQLAVEAEMAEHDSHARQNLPHLQRMADQSVEQWNATHDEVGRETTQTDALGRETERRGDRR
jgi:hypothetical protein